ncbi:MAG: cyclic nucleotide-binding domain-containing protein, partial [Candidatus Zixiibacteriota bacterium]
MVTFGVNSSNVELDLFLVRLAGEYSISRTYAPGEIIFSEGDPGDTMLFILDGIIQVTKRSPESGEVVKIAHRKAGDFLGEMALVEKTPRFATAVAESSCQVLEFSKDNFEKIIREQPALATRVLRSLSNKLRESDSQRITELEENNRRLTASNRELVRLNSFLDCIIDQSPSAVLLTTRDGRVFRMNRAAARMFDVADPEKDLNIQDLFTSLPFEELRRSYRRTWTGEVSGRRNAEEFPVFLSVTALTSHNDSILYLIICQDISELKAFNEMITQFEKYTCAQEAAAELAHDLKNYIGVLLGNIELMVSRFTADEHEKYSRTLNAIDKTSREMLQFIEDVMAYHDDKSDMVPADLRSLLRALVRFCHTQPRFERIRLSIDVSPQFPQRLDIRQGQFQSAIVNLLVNAAEALESVSPDEGRIIRVELGTSDDNEWALIRIWDNGPGIPPEHLEKVFKERFTTKPSGHGIGLVSLAKIIKA